MMRKRQPIEQNIGSIWLQSSLGWWCCDTAVVWWSKSTEYKRNQSESENISK